MSKPTDWNSELHAINARHKDKTQGEHNTERQRLLDVIESQQKQIDVAMAITADSPSVTRLKVDHKCDGEATAVAVASDWHVEETVDPRNVNGLNEYNLDIAEKRINAFFKNVVRLTEIQRKGTKIDRLILVLNGDLMTGYIHEELRETNSMSPTQTVIWLQDRIASGLELLGKNFSEIVIPCCYGNHGRNTLKPRHATGAANSYEWMLYKTLEKYLGDKATWQVSDGYHLFVEVYNKLLRIHHGDGLKYQGGIGGLTIPVEKAIASWNKAITADLDIFGHWHQSQQSPKWVCNGSLIGFNAYAIAIKAAFEPPSQTYFLYDKKRGRTITAPVFVD